MRVHENGLTTNGLLLGKSVNGAANSVRTTVQHVRVNLGSANIAVAEKFLNRADVVAVLQQMRCEAVTQRVTGRRLCDLGGFHARFIAFCTTDS